MIEKKVGWSTAASLAVTITFGIVHWLAPGLPTPPAYIVGGLATLVTFAAGYFAPHTHLRPVPPAELKLPGAVVTFDQPLTPAQMAKFRANWEGAATLAPAVQLPATTIGAAAVQLPATTTGPTP